MFTSVLTTSPLPSKASGLSSERRLGYRSSADSWQKKTSGWQDDSLLTLAWQKCEMVKCERCHIIINKMNKKIECKISTHQATELGSLSAIQHSASSTHSHTHTIILQTLPITLWAAWRLRGENCLLTSRKLNWAFALYGHLLHSLVVWTLHLSITDLHLYISDKCVCF